MKAQSIYFLFYSIFILINSPKSQNVNIGATANFGFSQVTSNFSASYNYEGKISLSGNIGVFIEKRIGLKSFFCVEAI